MSEATLVVIPFAVLALVALFAFVGCTNDYRPFTVRGGGEGPGPNGEPAPKSYVEAVVKSDPIAYWRLSDHQGSDVAKDEIPPSPGHFGTYLVKWTLDLGPSLNDSDPAATPARFDGTGHVEVPHDPAAFEMTQFTVEALVHPDSVDARRVVLSNLSSVSNMSSGGWALAVIPPPDPSNDGLFEGLARDGAGLVSVTAKFDFAGLGTAWHVAMTFDGMTLTLYKDGAEVDNHAVQAFVPNTQDPLQIGNGFKGAIQEVAVYGRALDAPEILAHYMANASPNVGP